MKLTKQKIAECAEWVEVNGLYPQPCGAELKLFLKFADISWDTYKAWMQKSDFSDAIKKAQEVFRSTTVVEVVNAMKKRALGYNEPVEDKHYEGQEVTEYDPQTRIKKTYKTGKAVLTKQVTRTIHHAPDVAAGIFLLTNLDPENWKNRRNDTTDLNASLEFEEPPQIIFTDGKTDKDDDESARVSSEV